jgi:hypothetical protein
MQSSSRDSTRPLGVRRRKRVSAALAALAAAGLLTLGIGDALASGAKAGNYSGNPTFQGTLVTSVTVNFTVPASKTKVKRLRLTPFIPNACGFAGPPPKETSTPAKIHNGKFTGTVKELADNGKVFGKAKVTGKFKAGGKVSGTFKSTILSAANCNAKYKFTAKVSGHSGK